jgi:hypothetical protein
MTRISRLLGVLLVAGALAGCGSSDASKTDDLRQFLQDAHEFDNGYDGLGEVTVSGGDVTVDTEGWADPSYGAYLYCAWVEDWLRGGGNGAADSQIVVVMDGAEVLRSRGASESCAEAEPLA